MTLFPSHASKSSHLGTAHRMGGDNFEEILTAEEVSEFLKIHKNTLYRLVHREEIPAHYLNGKGTLRFVRSEVLKWVTGR